MRPPYSTFYSTIVALSILGLVLYLYSGKSPEPNTLDNQIAEAGTTHTLDLSLEVADTPEKLVMGLSGREYMAPDAGMIFIFPTPEYPNFWMKDMLFALDFIWLDEELRIVDLHENIEPETYPEVISPSQLSNFVIEVNAGFVKENNLQIGDRLNLPDFRSI